MATSFMRYLGVLVLLLFAPILVKGDVSLTFYGDIVLQNVINSSVTTVNSTLSNALIAAVASAAGAPASLTSQVYAAAPNLVIMSTMWSTGSQSTVETAVATVNTTYQSWASGGDASISGALSHACVTSFGVQPTLVRYAQNCTYWAEEVPASTSKTCLRNLSLTFYTGYNSQSDARASLKAALCAFLPTECSLITYGALSTTQVTVSGSTSTLYVMPFTVMSVDRDATLATLVFYAQFASLLISQNITYILAGGVQVFYHGAAQSFAIAGTQAQCVQQMWYLIFLIILVPVILIVSHRLFYYGRASGKRSVKNAERDIRAGVHISAAPWGNFGAGGNAGAGAGYMYGPPQGYGAGGYGGGGGGGAPQGGAGFGPPPGGPQSYFAQPSATGAQGWGNQQYGSQQYGNQQYGGQQFYGQQYGGQQSGAAGGPSSQWQYAGGQAPGAGQWGGYNAGPTQRNWPQQPQPR